MRAPLLAIGSLLIGACGGEQAAPATAREFTDPGFVSAGDLRLHYALTLTSDLPPAIAGSYGIVQKPNLALLTLAITPASGLGPERFAASEIHAVATSLIGERPELSLRRVDEQGGPTYLATVEVRHREPITIEIQGRAVVDGPEFSTRWTREFYLE